MNRKLIAALIGLVVVALGAVALLKGGDDEGAAKIQKPSSLSSTTAPSLGGKPTINVPGGAEGTSSHEAAEGGSEG